MYALLNAEAGAMFDELIRSGGINELADQGQNGRANQLRASRFIPAVDYIRAQRVRTLLVQQMSALFDKVDAFLAPSTSDTVIACNLTGHPAIVVPAGFVEGLPIGLMVTGPLYKEERILQAAGAFETAASGGTSIRRCDATTLGPVKPSARRRGRNRGCIHRSRADAIRHRQLFSTHGPTRDDEQSRRRCSGNDLAACRHTPVMES